MTTALFVANTISINAFAAEVNTVEQTQNSEAVNTSVTETDSQAGETTTGDSTITEVTVTTEESSTTQSQESDQNVAQDTTKETTNDSKNEETESKETTDTKKETTKSTKTTKTTTTKKKTSTTKKKTSTKAVSTVSYSKSELRLLSSLIYCEAGGQSYAGKLAVGIVVVNRMESKAFPNTLKGVIYQKYQFGPVRNGSLNQALKAYDNNRFTSTHERQCIKAAKAALSGVKTITYTKSGKTIKKKLSGYYYFSGRLSNPRFTLGGHQFK